MKGIKVKGIKSGDMLSSEAPSSSAVVFLRGEPPNEAVKHSTAVSSNGTFSQLIHEESLTIQTLTDLYGVTSVVECNGDGLLQPRAVVLDQPQHKLHRGAYYITRKRARDPQQSDAAVERDHPPATQSSINAKAVHFNTRVVVKEFPVPEARGSIELPTSDCIEGRPSIDLMAAVDESNRRQLQKAICFKSFFYVNPTTGKSSLINLDRFNQMVKDMGSVDVARAAAKDRHARAMELFNEVDQILQIK